MTHITWPELNFSVHPRKQIYTFSIYAPNQKPCPLSCLRRRLGPTMPPRSALLISDLPPPIPALQRVFDEGAARRLRKAAEASSDKTAKNLPGGNAAGGPKNPSATAQIPPPSFATQVFLQLPFLRTRRSSNFEVLVYSEQTLAERQADFHRSLYARLDEAEQGQEDHEQWLAMQVEVVFSPLGDLPARTQ
jgi:hypothetical protein